MSTPTPPARLPVGQILVRLLFRFRQEMFERGRDAEMYSRMRPAHLHIWGNITRKGMRLTVLAEKCGLSISACSELVTELEEFGYLARQPDPADGRAKLIVPTQVGHELIDDAQRWTREVESEWASLLQPGEFENALLTLNALLPESDD